MARPGHFEIHAGDPEKAIAFYSGVFDWKFTSWGGPVEYWIIKTGEPSEPGIDGGLVRRRGAAPLDGQAVNAYVCTIIVESLDQVHGKVLELGGTIAHEKNPIPGVGWLAYYKDTDGNIFGVMQNDPLAK